jgi:hypothetical protein
MLKNQSSLGGNRISNRAPSAPSTKRQSIHAHDHQQAFEQIVECVAAFLGMPFDTFLPHLLKGRSPAG